MKVLVDAQLPRRLSRWLESAGHEAMHTLDLPEGNRTPDSEICAIADRDGRAVITKDDDFVYSHLVANTPVKLLLISTGNMGNADLLALVETHIGHIAQAFTDHHFVELTRTGVLLHE